MADPPPPRRTVAWFCAVAVTPIAWTVLAQWGDWRPVGDVAVIGLRAGDVLTRDPPLVGMPTTLSRSLGTQAYHPGPLEFWLLALPVKLTSGWRLAPMLTIAAANAAAVAAMVALAGRAAGRMAAVAATTAALVVLASLRGEVLVDPYNPHAALLPLTACVLALAADLAGVRWALVVAALAGSFAAQAHLASAAVVGGAVAAWAVAAVLLRPSRPLRIAVVVLALCWAPVAVGELVDDGNLRRLADSAGEQEDTIGVRGGRALAANALAPPAVWMSPSSRVDEALGPPGLGRGMAAVAVAAAAVAVGIAWQRRGYPFVLVVVALALAALVAGGVATTRIPAANALGLHSFVWTWGVGATVWAAMVGGAVALVRPPRPRAAAAAVALGAATLLLLVAPPRVLGTGRMMEATGDLASELADRLPPGTYGLQWGEGGLDAKNVMIGLRYALKGSALDLRLAPADAPSVTERRTAAIDDVDRVLVVAVGRTPPRRPVPDARVVAHFAPRRDPVRRVRQTEGEVLRVIDAAGGVRLDSGARFAGDEAVDLVESGGLVLYDELGVVAEPDFPRPLLRRLATRQAEPVTYVRVFLLPRRPN